MISPYLELSPRSEAIFRSMREKAAKGHRACPFCGDIPCGGTVTRTGWVMVGCENDACTISPMASGKTLKEAFERWDTRADSVKPAGACK